MSSLYVTPYCLRGIELTNFLGFSAPTLRLFLFNSTKALRLSFSLSAISCFIWDPRAVRLLSSKDSPTFTSTVFTLLD